MKAQDIPSVPSVNKTRKFIYEPWGVTEWMQNDSIFSSGSFNFQMLDKKVLIFMKKTQT
jgi:hypothetical protein